MLVCRLVSERGDSNARPLRPERSALPTALLSDVPFYDRNIAEFPNCGGEVSDIFLNERILCYYLFTSTSITILGCVGSLVSNNMLLRPRDFFS